MDVLIIGDIHLSGKNPPNRIDDVTEIQFNKIEEIVNIANTTDTPIICTGDIFHTPIVSNQILSKFGKLINKLKREFYFVFGNHDLQYHDIIRVDRTSIGVIRSNNYKIRHISEFHKFYGSRMRWAYIDYGAAFTNNYLNTEFNKANFLLSHKAIVNDNLINTESWIANDVNFCQSVSNFEGMFKLIICGHWHKPYIYRYKNSLIINPGPVIRRQITEKEIPRIIYIDLETLKYDEIHLSTAPPTELVLREESIDKELRPVEDRIIHFINNIKHKKGFAQKLKFKDALNVLINDAGTDKKVVNKLKEIMSILSERKGEELNVDN
jgi:DNA repair exonuclease SbcCD nuclease subunit